MRKHIKNRKQRTLLSARISPDMDHAIEHAARAAGIGKSELIRLAVCARIRSLGIVLEEEAA